MYLIFRNLIIGWLLSVLFLGCSGPSQENVAIYEGTEVREEFLAQHSGEYVYDESLKDYWSTKSLKINKDTTYEMKFEGYRINPADRLGRTAVCSGIHRGRILYVRKIGREIGSLRTGFSTHIFGPPRFVELYLYLSDPKTELTSTKTEYYNRITQSSDVLTGSREFTKEEYADACRRSSPELVHIERVLPNALVIADVYNGSPRPISQRFLVKDQEEWIWMDGPVARQMVAEASERLSYIMDGVRAFDVEPVGLKSSNRRFDLRGKMEFDAKGKLKVSLGLKAIDQFISLLTLEGDFAGASYRPKTRELVVHLAKPYSAYTYDWSSVVDRTISEVIQRETPNFTDLKYAINNSSLETIQFAVNMGSKDSDRILKIFGK